MADRLTEGETWHQVFQLPPLLLSPLAAKPGEEKCTQIWTK